MPVVQGQQRQGVVVAALSGAELMRSLPLLDGCCVAVFDRPDRLVRLAGVRGVDFGFDGLIPRFKKFNIKDLDFNRLSPVEVRLADKPRDVLREMLDNSDHGILNGVLTFIYTIRNTKVRKDITEIVYPWFFATASVDHLFRRLKKNFPSVDFQQMEDLFADKHELIDKIREAARSYSLRRHPDFRAYCEERAVPFYDLHYLCMVVKSQQAQAKKDQAKV